MLLEPPASTNPFISAGQKKDGGRRDDDVGNSDEDDAGYSDSDDDDG